MSIGTRNGQSQAEAAGVALAEWIHYRAVMRQANRTRRSPFVSQEKRREAAAVSRAAAKAARAARARMMRLGKQLAGVR